VAEAQCRAGIVERFGAVAGSVIGHDPLDGDAEAGALLFLVERFFQKIKNFRCIATRDDRRARHYLAMRQLVATIIWLK